MEQCSNDRDKAFDLLMKNINFPNYEKTIAPPGVKQS